MAERAQHGEKGPEHGQDPYGHGPYAPGNNPADPNEHRHGDDFEYDEAHDPEQDEPRGGGGGGARGEVF